MKIYDHITCLLTSSIENDLLIIYKNWLNFWHPNHELTVKIGSGESTYFQFNDNNKHFINIGKKMISQSIESSLEASKWTHGQEIIHRNYFGGVLTIQNVLVQAIIHEFSHFIDSLNHGNIKNICHGDSFYNILDGIHWKYNIAQKILNKLNKDEIFSQLSFVLDDYSYPIKIPKNSNILFKFNNEFIEGKVFRRNKYTVSVFNEEGKWSVPYGFICRII